MKKKIFPFSLPLLGLLILSGCSPTSQNINDFDKFSWLEGQWFDSAGSFYESWQREEDGTIRGGGYQIKQGDTVFGESLSIEKQAGDWKYVVKFGNEVTAFRLVTLPGDSLAFENRENEFPKRITYLNRGNGKITAIIENPGEPEKSVQFNFTAIH